MRVAICNEISSCHRNQDIINALEGFDLEIFNIGMKDPSREPALTYIHTGFLSALLLNLNKVDFVIGGCGTGIGYMNSVLQYPGVVCGHILNPLDAWLFSEINQGNCVSLALNQGYGWAADKNLRYIFEQMFGKGHGLGYPADRAESQAASRKTINDISAMVHLPFAKIVEILPSEILNTVLNFPGVKEMIDSHSNNEKELKDSIVKQLMQLGR